MKKFIFSCTVLFLGYKSPAQELRIPFTIQSGYGPFYRTISTITTDKRPDNALPIKGIPTNLDSAQLRVIKILPNQYQYQNLVAGKTKEKHPGNWIERIEKETLTEKEIKCFINIASGINRRTGKPEVIVDKNHNNDFSDDTAFTPPRLDEFNDERMMEKATLPIAFERYNGEKIITEKARLLIAVNSKKTIMVNFPQFGSAAWNGCHFFISPKYFMSLSYVKSNLVFGINRLATDRTPLDQIVEQGQFLTVKGQAYQFLGVDILTQHIRLKKTNQCDIIRADQIGRPAPLLKGREILTDQRMDIADFPGKYIFIDFWATWCKPCLAQLRSIQTHYQLTDTSKVAFIGVGIDSPKGGLKATITRFKLTYPQIVLDSAIERKYYIPALPANRLIDKNNTIIASDISIDSLGTFVKENDLLK